MARKQLPLSLVEDSLQNELIGYRIGFCFLAEKYPGYSEIEKIAMTFFSPIASDFELSVLPSGPKTVPTTAKGRVEGSQQKGTGRNHQRTPWTAAELKWLLHWSGKIPNKK